MTNKQKQKHVQKIIDAAGGLSVVGRHFGIAPSSVKGWITRGEIPDGRILRLSALTKWECVPHMIDPSIYPNKTDGLPSSLSKRTDQ